MTPEKQSVLPFTFQSASPIHRDARPRFQDCLWHQGRRFALEAVQSLPARHGKGRDTLFIDTRGQHYLRRQLPRRTLVHRLSTLATIQWELAANAADRASQRRLRQMASALFRQAPEPVALDVYAQMLVQAELRQRPHADASDLVNAGVYFLLGDGDTDSEACREQARQRRKGYVRYQQPQR